MKHKKHSLDKYTILKLIGLYGHLIAKNRQVNNFELAKLICDNYCISNPITFDIYHKVLKMDGILFKNDNGRINILHVR